MSSVALQQDRYSEWIDRAARKPLDLLRNSILGHQEALEEIEEVWEECRNPGWDGYGALAVEEDTRQAARLLIQSLPLGFPRPSIGAEPDGHLTLEWRKSPTRVFSVSVDPDGYLHYAGLYGANQQCGRLTFFASAPSKLLDLVLEL